MLSKQDIMAAQAARQFEVRNIEPLGGEVRIKRLSAAAVITANAGKDADAVLISKSIVDADGERLFTAQEAKELDADVFAALGRAVASVNGWDQSPAETEKN